MDFFEVWPNKILPKCQICQLEKSHRIYTNLNCLRPSEDSKRGMGAGQNILPCWGTNLEFWANLYQHFALLGLGVNLCGNDSLKKIDKFLTPLIPKLIWQIKYGHPFSHL